MKKSFWQWRPLLLAVLVVLYLVTLGIFTYANVQADEVGALWMHLVNALILSLPLVLFYGGIYVLASIWRQRRAGAVDPTLSRVVRLAPRLAAIVIILFVTLFSLDVFDEPGTPFQRAALFLVHSLPSIVMVIFLAVAWKRPVVGFAGFLLTGLAFLLLTTSAQFLGNLLLFTGPLLVIAALFYADWRWNAPVEPQA